MKVLELSQEELELLVDQLDTTLFMESDLLEYDRESGRDVKDQEVRVKLLQSILDKLK
ncbi:hypothetical protein J7D02_003878 [Salmonella enterica subsp. enterica serovar Enteritidis]|uniref:Uncharacterized protein n=3 Tax=Rosemountvirus TaxID=2733127 RepID=A0A6G8RB66_9CAUD|nr:MULTISPECIES: hypothetical protein [Gammaproteobacteria]AWW14698.1 hypothetical protein vBSalMLPSEYT_00002 [Salmonella phage vB_SalM-LPSEYT]EHH0526839.1 hypothetical protein [Salmonella enterica subsp. enterica serovar Enteritidis]MDR5453662.1 hypothetical protein [Salmonella enterica subsp. enterica serovar Rissen]QIN98673.1 hypothetical protein brunost_10 [Salmonella phage brunost]QIN98958.1 hypothetical protein renfri_10 [Salmonella phage renfri]QOC55421.1 hypothetical protein JEP7_64 [